MASSLGVYDVEATTPVHQYFGEPHVADDRVDNKQISAWLQDAIRVVVAVKCDGRLRPLSALACAGT
jgi:hypothetical protein